VQDPRERPLAKQAAADERHAKFADERSDFLALLKLWKLQGEQGLRRLCRDTFLSYPRMREWRDVHLQLQNVVGELDWKASSAKADRPDGYRAIHRALLAGLLGNVGMKDEADHNFTGARGIKFWVHPGSGTKKPGKWIVAAELVETTRLYARTVATIEPQWLEELGAHLLKRHRDNPHWEKMRAQVVAVERGTLYGLPVYTNRRVHYGPLDPDLSRGIFIRSALVEGELDTRAPFFAHNRRLLAEIERLEHKSRRPDILVDDELIHAFYDARIPEGIHNGADFDAWRKDAEREDPKLLHLKREDLMRHEAAGITTDNFPHELKLGANAFRLDYHFDPRSPRDGVTMTVPVALLNQVSAARCEWLVPGLLKEKVRALAKSMPQRLRHKLGPLEEFAETFAAQVPPTDTPLAQALARQIRAELDLEVPVDAFRPDSAPPHLHMNFLVIDEHERQLAMGRNLAVLKRDLAEQTAAVLQSEAPLEEGERYAGWTMGELAEVMEIARGGQTLVGYPALVDAGAGEDGGVTLQVFDAPEKARALHRDGVRRLLAIAFKDRVRELERGWSRDVLLGPVKEDLVAASLDRAFFGESLPMTPGDFARCVDEGRSRFMLVAQELARTAAAILGAHVELQKKLAQTAKACPQAVDDVKLQLGRLLRTHWLADTPWARLQHYPRYLKAAALRLEKLRADPAREARLAAELQPLLAGWLRAPRPLNAELEQFGWLLEELRVSLFAQELKTPVPVSAKRLAKLWQSIRK
jgi:ATP-dependent helicase HrpA